MENTKMVKVEDLKAGDKIWCRFDKNFNKVVRVHHTPKMVNIVYEEGSDERRKKGFEKQVKVEEQSQPEQREDDYIKTRNANYMLTRRAELRR